MFGVNNKNTSTTSITSFWCFYCWLIYFRKYILDLFSVPIGVDFEQVDTNWEVDLSELVNPLGANFTKWSNTLKQFFGNLPTYCLSVFDHFVKMALKGLTSIPLKSSEVLWFSDDLRGNIMWTIPKFSRWMGTCNSESYLHTF